MKIRTDFVTNSSSSSFVVEIDIETVDGKAYHARIPSNPDLDEDYCADVECTAESLLQHTSVQELMDAICDASGAESSVRRLRTNVTKYVTDLDRISKISFTRYWYAWGEYASCFGTNINTYAPELCELAHELCEAEENQDQEEIRNIEKEMYFRLRYYSMDIGGHQSESFPTGFMGAPRTCALDIGQRNGMSYLAHDIVSGSMNDYDTDEGIERTVINMHDKTIWHGAVYGNQSGLGMCQDDSDYEELAEFVARREAERHEKKQKKFVEAIALWKSSIPFDHVSTIDFYRGLFVTTGLERDTLYKYLRDNGKISCWDSYPARYWLQKKGAIVTSNVTCNCDYLIVGMDATIDTPKVTKAIQLRDSGKSNIKIIPEDELLRMLNGEVLEISEEDQRAMQAREDAIQHAADETLRLQQEAARRVDEEKRAAREERARQREQAKAALEEYRKERREARQAASQQRQEAAAAAKAEKRRLAAEERDRKIADEVLYRPGEEPEILQARISVLFEQLDAAYPDKQISSLQAQHKKLSEKANEIRKQLGYPDSQAFLEAYGYTIVNSQGGRPSTVDPDAVIEELKRRYPHGGYSSVAKLMAANSDLPLKTLQNNAQKLFGMSLGDYLKEIGVLS